MLDVYGVGLAVGPVGEVLRGEGCDEAVFDGGGEEVVPLGVAAGEPAGRGVEDDLFFGVGFLTPDVELVGFADGEVGFGGEEHGPEGVAGGVDDGGGYAVGVDVAVPGAEEIGGLLEAFGVGGDVGAGVVDGVGEALGDDVVDVGVDVGLELEHGFRSEVLR